MTRLTHLDRNVLDGGRLRLWDTIVEAKGPVVFAEGGGMVGPLNAWLTASDIGERIVALWTFFASQSVVETRLREVAIITTAAHWHAEFEWWAHRQSALAAGVSGDVVESIAAGREPSFSNDDEQLMYEVARQLATHGSVDDASYERAHDLLGERGVIELVSVCGFYTLVSFTLNTFQVALPAGATPIWRT